MLTQPEFEALLDHYLAGSCLPGEQQLVEQWGAQLGQVEPQQFDEEQRAATRAIIWQHLEKVLNALDSSVSGSQTLLS